MAVTVVKATLAQMGFTSTLRAAVNKAGPVITDSGNMILDVLFTTDPSQSAGFIADVRAWHHQVVAIPGVVETGLFCGMVDHVYFGMQDGTVSCTSRTGTAAQ